MPRRRSRARRRQRRLLLLVTVVAVVALGWFGGGFSVLEDLLTDQVDAGPQDVTGELDPDLARERLDELTVAAWDATRGYSRDRFSHWVEEDGCDVRQRVLRRDGEQVSLAEDSCRVVEGRWHSPFDGVTLTDPSEIDIDHMVPLANAWRTGASAWDDQRRADFANDLERPQLLAVSASSNRAKGDQDPSQWQPQRSYWCQYAHDWVMVKHHWELWVTADERTTLADMLDTCDEGES